MPPPEPIHLTTTITDKESGMRLDQALASLIPDYSRSQWQQWIKQGCITVNHEEVTQPKTKVIEHQIIELTATLLPKISWEPQPLDIDIIYEDNAIIVINKPAGLVTHPGAGNPDNTLVNALLYHHPALEQLPRAGIVHRLDKDTTGLMIIAKTLQSHQFLVQAIQQRCVKREYVAIAQGNFIAGGTLNYPIGRHPIQRTKMAVNPAGKHATTHYKILEHFKHHSHLHITLETGRTHQIRVHFSHIKHPLVGDPTYGNKRNTIKPCNESLRKAINGFNRQALHATRLTLQEHPESKKTISWEIPPPKDFQNLLEQLRLNEAED